MVFSDILANIERSEMDLYEIPRLLFLLGFGMMLASFYIHMWYDACVKSNCIYLCEMDKSQGAYFCFESDADLIRPSLLFYCVFLQ